MKNIGRNFMYQTLFQLMKIILPIVTIPLVAEALGPTGVGVYNYTQSIAQYFVLIAGLGIDMYGNREIAMIHHQNGNLSKVFWEIVYLKVLLSIIVLLSYLVIVSFFSDRVYFYFQGLLILSVLIDISWFFMGIEEFKMTSLTSLVVQIIVFFLLVFFVKKPTDLTHYIVIQAGATVATQGLIWLHIRPHISFECIQFKGILRHLKGMIEFFIPQMAITFYTNLNKTLLGIFLGSVAVGYYTNSLLINTVFVMIITTIDIVLLPHMSGLYAKKDTQKMIQLMDQTIHLQLFFSLPILFGMLTVYDKLVPWFFGDQFQFITHVIPFFSLLIVIIPLGMAVSRQYLIPIGQVKAYNRSVIIGAIINLLSNLLLLPTIGFYGVVFSNLLAELFVTITRIIFLKKNTTFRFNLRKIGLFFSSAVIMMVGTRAVSAHMPPTLLTNLFQVSMGLLIYFSLTALSKVNPVLDYFFKK